MMPTIPPLPDNSLPPSSSSPSETDTDPAQEGADELEPVARSALGLKSYLSCLFRGALDPVFEEFTALRAEIGRLREERDHLLIENRRLTATVDRTSSPPSGEAPDKRKT